MNAFRPPRALHLCRDVCLALVAGDRQRTAPAVGLLGRMTAAAALVLIGATWRLWTPQGDFPRVPLLGIFRWTPDGLEWAALALACVAWAIALLAGSRSRLAGGSILVAVTAMAILVLADQHRLQPWAWHFAVLALILASLPVDEAIKLARLVVVSIYFFSAISKADWTFIESGGGPIIDGLLTFLHSGAAISARHRSLLAAALPTIEFLVASGLLRRRTRRFALWASIGMHALLLAALGPWGADHRAGVLLWNVYFIVQNIVLFGMAGEGSATAGASPRHAITANDTAFARPARNFVRGLVAFALLFPCTEPLGICDAWPAWAVYATAPERLRVYVSDPQRLPVRMQRYVEAPQFLGFPLRIDRWSLDSTQAPLYPQNRFRLGLALACADAWGENVIVELDGPANRRTGERQTRTLYTREELVAELHRYWLNGFPR